MIRAREGAAAACRVETSKRTVVQSACDDEKEKLAASERACAAVQVACDDEKDKLAASERACAAVQLACDDEKEKLAASERACAVVQLACDDEKGKLAASERACAAVQLACDDEASKLVASREALGLANSSHEATVKKMDKDMKRTDIRYANALDRISDVVMEFHARSWSEDDLRHGVVEVRSKSFVDTFGCEPPGDADGGSSRSIDADSLFRLVDPADESVLLEVLSHPDHLLEGRVVTRTLTFVRPKDQVGCITRRSRYPRTCRVHMQSAHAECTCRVHMQSAHAEYTCRVHMQSAHAECTSPPHRSRPLRAPQTVRRGDV